MNDKVIRSTLEIQDMKLNGKLSTLVLSVFLNCQIKTAITTYQILQH